MIVGRKFINYFKVVKSKFIFTLIIKKYLNNKL